MGRGRSLYQEYSWWGKCWLLSCLGETVKGRVCERWPGRPPGLTPGGFFPGIGTGGSVDEGRGPGAQCISLTPDKLISVVLGRGRFDLKKLEQWLCLKSVSEMYWAQGLIHTSPCPYTRTTPTRGRQQGGRNRVQLPPILRGLLCNPLKAYIDKVEIVCKYRAFCAVLFLNG